MQVVISEEQQEHIYIGLVSVGKEFGKLRKKTEDLAQPTDKIDAQIALNTELRTMFNPRAEEEARAAERAKRGDPAQLVIGDELGANYASEDTLDGHMAHAEVASTRTPHEEKPTVEEALGDETNFPGATASVNGGPKTTVEKAARQAGEAIAEEIKGRRKAKAGRAD